MRRALVRTLRALLPLAVLSLSVLGADAQDMAFVQIPGIPGESDDAAHTDWIDAYAIDHSASHAGGGGPSFSEVAFLKGTDKSSPRLHRKLADASAIAGTVVLEVCRLKTPQECYYRLDLTDTRIVTIDLAGSSCVDPATSCTPPQTESVGMNYRTIKWTYTEFDAAGNPVGNVIECWDTVTNTAC